MNIVKSKTRARLSDVRIKKLSADSVVSDPTEYRKINERIILKLNINVLITIIVVCNLKLNHANFIITKLSNCMKYMFFFIFYYERGPRDL